MILLDTHVIVWLALDPGRISRKAKTAIEQARARNEALAIADITLFEIASLARKLRIEINTGLETFLSEVESRFVVLPMNSQVCAQAVSFSSGFPKDPADRLIAATALTVGVPLVSADRALQAARGLRTIW